MKIGVFDSGVGGLSVAQAIERALPNNEVIFRNDATHVPYGNRDVAEIFSFTLPILESLIADGCEVLVIACNTVTTNLITDLRRELSVPLVAVEPMVKPAASLTKSNVIAVCATPSTLRSPRYRWLKEHYAQNITVLEPDCSAWSQLIETKQLSHQQISDELTAVLKAGADVIVLACTHYHWIQADIIALCAGRATVIQPETAIIRQLQRVIEDLTAIN